MRVIGLPQLAEDVSVQNSSSNIYEPEFPKLNMAFGVSYNSTVARPPSPQDSSITTFLSSTHKFNHLRLLHDSDYPRFLYLSLFSLKVSRGFIFSQVLSTSQSNLKTFMNNSSSVLSYL